MNKILELPQRIENGRGIYIDRETSTVWHWDADELTALSCVARTYFAPLYALTPPMLYHGQGVTSRPFYAEAQHPENDTQFTRLREALRVIHEYDDVGQDTAPPIKGDVFYYERVARRLLRNCPEFLGEWQSFCSSINVCAMRMDRVCWHGDPTAANCLIQPSGRLWLIDHAPEATGPAEYDEAKVRRSECLRNDLTWRLDPRRYRGDVHLACVIAGMIGNHGTVPQLVEFWREVTGR